MKKLSQNIVASISLQVCNILSGLIIPRLILSAFGSNVNGLVASITQFTNYIALLEGGVSSVMMANLYKPLYENDIVKISAIFATMQKFFRQISLVFLTYQLILAALYPVFVNTGFDWDYVFTLTLILGLNNFVQYTFSISCKLLLEADNKIYITKGIHTIVVVLNTIVTVLIIKYLPSIHIVKLASALVYTIQPIIYNSYIEKCYELDKKAAPDNSTLNQRWNGLGINIAYFVHNNTDVCILTLFSTLLLVSVYHINLVVINGIRTIVFAILSSFIPVLGKKIAAGNKENLIKYFYKYEFICFYVASIAFTIGTVLIEPFIRVYTAGINDVNYVQPLFEILMLTGEWIYCIREPYVELAYQSNKFKEISKYAYAEATINIMVSAILVRKLGLVGVAIGTVSGMLFRAICHVYYGCSIIPYKTTGIVKYALISFATAFISNYLLRLTPLYNADGVKEFLLLAVVSAAVVVGLFTLVMGLANRHITASLIRDLHTKS